MSASADFIASRAAISPSNCLSLRLHQGFGFTRLPSVTLTSKGRRIVVIGNLRLCQIRGESMAYSVPSCLERQGFVTLEFVLFLQLAFVIWENAMQRFLAASIIG